MLPFLLNTHHKSSSVIHMEELGWSAEDYWEGGVQTMPLIQ